MTAFRAIFLRELRAYFSAPLAYVFLGVYVLLSGLATWNIARFFDTARVDLTPFFQFQPWLMAILAPAIGMRLWSEDLKNRTSDLYFTGPVPLIVIHLGKAAAGAFVLLAALIVTLPYWVAASYLGTPDYGVILLDYLTLFAMSVVFLLVSMAFSAATRQQVVALILGVVTNLMMLVLGLNLVTTELGGFLPGFAGDWLQGFSLIEIWLNAQRGLFVLPDFLSLLIIAALSVLAALILLESRRRSRSEFLTSWPAASLALLIFAVPMTRYVVSELTEGVRADLTGYRLNTLSEGSKALAREVKEPIELTFYYSEDIGADYPDVRIHAEIVSSMLSVFERFSDGNIRIRRIDPAPFSAGEDEAILRGVSAVPTEGLDPLYFGISGQNLVDDVETIPFLAPEQEDRLEFEIASLIARLDRVTAPHIGVLSGVPALSAESASNGTSQIGAELTELYRVSWLSPRMYSLPENMDALIIAQPPALTDHAIFLIDQFALKGGRIIIMSDPLPLLHDRAVIDGKLAGWLGALGVTLSETALADAVLGLPVAVQTENGTQTLRQPLFPGPGPAEFSSTDFLTASLQRAIHFGAPGAITLSPVDGLSASALIQTSDNSGRVDPGIFAASDQTPQTVRSLMEMGEAGTLAVRLSGETPVVIGTPPDADLPEDPVLSRLAQAELGRIEPVSEAIAPAEILIVADTDFLFGPFYINPQNGESMADNAAFLLGALDQFAGNPNLARLRARAPSIRPMTRVTRLREAAEADYLVEQSRLETELSSLRRALDEADGTEAALLRRDYLNARQDLRLLQRQFRASIDQLEAVLRFCTIWLPLALLLVLAAIARPISRRLGLV